MTVIIDDDGRCTMRGVAICCGFNDYDVKPLERAVNDAAILYTRLTESGMFNTAPELIGKSKLFTQQTSANVILAALICAAESTAELVWFSFSGHSAVSCDGELRLLLPGWRSESSEDEKRRYSIGADEIENVLRSRLATKKFVVMLDACHSGAFGRGAITRDITPPIEARIARAGAVVISSCASHQLALDGHLHSSDLNGAFTAAVIKVLEEHTRTGRALTVLHLFQAAKARLMNGQLPTLYANGLTDDFLVLGKPDEQPPAEGLVTLSTEVPIKIKNELETFLNSVVQIHRRQRVGLVHAERQLENLAAEFYRYRDETFVVSGHNTNVIEAFDNARSCILGCTTPTYIDEWRRGGIALLASNRDFVARSGGRVIRLFFVPDDFQDRLPGLLNVARDHVKAGILAVLVNVDSFGPALLQKVFRNHRSDDLSQLECAFIDGKVFLKTHFAANGELKIEVDQRPARCQNEYKTQLRPFLTSPNGVLFSVGIAGNDPDGVTLHQLRSDDISELRQQIEVDLGLLDRAA